jgi:hypothetical protein
MFDHQPDPDAVTPAAQPAEHVTRPRSLPMKPLVIQAKMVVGAANDRFEREADDVADQVMRLVPAAGDVRSRELSPPHGRIRRSPAAAMSVPGLAGGPVDDAVAGRIRRSHGTPLGAPIRRTMEDAFGADFGHVRIHTGAEAEHLNRQVGAEAFTTGNDIFFGEGRYRPQSFDGQRLLAHELTHTIQQGSSVEQAGKVRRSAALSDRPSGAAVEIRERACEGALQRHASWEHMLIGDLTPDELSTLGAAYDVTGDNRSVQVGNATINREDVVHVIQQEVDRLTLFQAKPPTVEHEREIDERTEKLKVSELEKRYDTTFGSAEDPNLHSLDTDFEELANQVGAEWDVKLVAVPNKSGKKFLVTYGELNTLADFFGSVEEMRDMDEKWVDRLIRSVRKSQLNELLRVYAMVQGLSDDPVTQLGGKSARQKAMKSLGLESDDFKSESGESDAFELVGTQAELALMGAGPLALGSVVKPKVGGEASTDYSSTLARNACHFAPESWHAWSTYHEKARVKALAAFAERQKLTDPNLDPNQRPAIESQAAELGNEAMLYNGFGDHYLQDSYAAGHLINKTLIMQWYVKWIDSDKSRWKAHQDKNWQKVQQMAYNQPGLADRGQYKKASVGQDRDIGGKTVPSARNPQTVENISEDWRVKAKALGLTVPGSLAGGTNTKKLLVEWQHAILTFKAPEVSFASALKWLKSEVRVTRPTDMKVADLVKIGAKVGLGDGPVKQAICGLFNDGIIVKGNYDNTDRAGPKLAPNALRPGDEFVLRDEYIPKDMSVFTRGKDDDNAFQDMALGVTYNEYLAFMNSAYLQKATNSLHDVFCEQGLNVFAGDNRQLEFKIYGDNAMLKQSSSVGLRHSGETAKRSRNAILDLISTGHAVDTTATIIGRVPNRVNWKGTDVSLARWHGEGGALQTFCNDTLFPSLAQGAVNTVFNKLAPGIIGQDLGTITKNAPHGNEVF